MKRGESGPKGISDCSHFEADRQSTGHSLTLRRFGQATAGIPQVSWAVIRRIKNRSTHLGKKYKVEMTVGIRLID